MTTQELACKAIAYCIRYNSDHTEKTVGRLINEWKLTSNHLGLIEGYMRKERCSEDSHIECISRNILAVLAGSGIITAESTTSSGKNIIEYLMNEADNYRQGYYPKGAKEIDEVIKACHAYREKMAA